MILNIDLNSVTYTCGWTGFHCACQNGQLKIAEFLMENSDIFDIDVTGFILLETSVIAKNSTKSSDILRRPQIFDPSSTYNLTLLSNVK